MIEKVKTFMKEHQLLEANSNVLVGVSGGPDSMALLHFFSIIREVWNLNVIAVTVDHQLRGEESLDDLAYVRQMCDQWNIQFVGTSLDVPSYKKEKQMGTQEAARNLRYGFFEKQMKSFDADVLALGHHGDDQIETVIMALARTADPGALSGIPVKRDFANGMIIRPFLCTTKDELEAYCVQQQIIPRRDPSNDETVYTRNFFRKQLLPLLKDRNPNIHNTVQHLSEVLQEDERFLLDEAAEMVQENVKMDHELNKISFDSTVFSSFPYSLQRRAYHLILNYLYKKWPKNLSYVHEQQFFDLLHRTSGNTHIDFPYNLKLNNMYGTFVLFFPEEQPEAPSVPAVMEIPSETNWYNGTITACYTDDPGEQSEMSYACGKEEVALPLHVRTRRNGDRMCWKGLQGSKKLKDIFIDAKVPLTERDKWPVVVDNNGTVLWLVGLKKRIPEVQREYDTYIQLKFEKRNSQEGQHA
ncbi:tRNA lysidine(34) synthetase TilS [Virgibacillus siamensis]|uniref:tRNA lysidine(34) synthetase TilS n=1 Tax=Virgibacillus siamensis TaxID=480071 RepID=UPI0009856E42|nr:tRNA lysidine(34) synthetase TilS [Virgibacillus siamensis]